MPNRKRNSKTAVHKISERHANSIPADTAFSDLSADLRGQVRELFDKARAKVREVARTLEEKIEKPV